MKSQVRGNHFDTLGLLFAVPVIFSHSYPPLPGSKAVETLARVTH